MRVTIWKVLCGHNKAFNNDERRNLNNPGTDQRGEDFGGKKRQILSKEDDVMVWGAKGAEMGLSVHRVQYMHIFFKCLRPSVKQVE